MSIQEEADRGQQGAKMRPPPLQLDMDAVLNPATADGAEAAEPELLVRSCSCHVTHPRDAEPRSISNICIHMHLPRRYPTS